MEKNKISINNMIRKNIQDLYKIDNLEEFSFDIFESISSKDRDKYPAAYATLSLIFLDTYKELNSRILDGTASLSEIELFSILKSVSSLNEVMDLYILFPEYMNVSIAYNIEFNNSNEISKIRKIKQLSNQDNKFLLSVSPIHENDLEEYDNILNKDWLYEYYKDFKNELEEKKIVYSPEVLYNMMAGSLSIIENKEDVVNLISSVINDIFKNEDNIDSKESIEYLKNIKSYINYYRLNEKSFAKTSLDSRSTLSYLLKIYCEMKTKKDKTLKKDLNEK